MAKESSSAEQGVPSFEYNPLHLLNKQGLLFQLSRPLSDLEGLLIHTFAGRTLSMQEIYMKHNVDTPYIKSNYKEVLKKLENNGIIKTKKPDGSRRRPDTFADDILVTFPN